jgi:hypothetical protein
MCGKSAEGLSKLVVQPLHFAKDIVILTKVPSVAAAKHALQTPISTEMCTSG